MPTQLPDGPVLPETGFVRLAQLLTFIPLSKSTLWRRINDGSFPSPIKLSERVTVWRAEDVRRWIQEIGTQAPTSPALQHGVNPKLSRQRRSSS